MNHTVMLILLLALPIGSTCALRALAARFAKKGKDALFPTAPAKVVWRDEDEKDVRLTVRYRANDQLRTLKLVLPADPPVPEEGLWVRYDPEHPEIASLHWPGEDAPPAHRTL